MSLNSLVVIILVKFLIVRSLSFLKIKRNKTISNQFILNENVVPRV